MSCTTMHLDEYTYYTIYKMTQTIFINLTGGPCCGKTTTAASLFSELKRAGINAELLTEPVKDYIYEENNSAISSQIKLFAEALYKMKQLDGKADVVVTDCPLLHNIVYDQEDNKVFHTLVIQEYNKFTNIDFFLERGDMPFEQFGRIHSYQQSVELDNKIKMVYNYANAPYITVDNEHAVEQIMETIYPSKEQVPIDEED